MVFCLGLALCGSFPTPGAAGSPVHRPLVGLPYLVAHNPPHPPTHLHLHGGQWVHSFVSLLLSFTSLLWPSHLTTALEPSLATRGKGKVSLAFIENSPSSLEKLQKYGFNVPFKFWIKKECEATHVFLSGCHFL